MPYCNCEICGESHYVKPCRMNRSHFCSHECYSKSMVITVKAKCTFCGKALTRKPSGIHDENFCNLKCRDAYRQGNKSPRYKECPDKLCKVCGKKIKHKSAIRSYSTYCSRKCKADANSGNNCHFWNGGTWVYSRGFTPKLKKQIRERDGNKCFMCGNANKYLHIHHIDCDKKNHNPSNLVTLCPKCHLGAHSRFGKGLKEIIRRATP